MHIIQNPVIPTKQKIKNNNLKFRHSRAGGDPACSVSVLFRFVISKPSFPRRREPRPLNSGISDKFLRH
ncbi:hypothetical protein COI07_03820 [Neisseria meningitidis]|nr:hypothetical protein COI07_03820 [Neisseria meningitidis]